MTIKRCSGLLLATVAISATAFADDTGLYLGGSLGESQQRFDATTFDVRTSDLAYKFALGYRPLKVVAAELDAQSPFHSFHRTGTDVAYGFGASTSWGSLGARVEYERYDVSHANDMALASVGLTWVFL